MDGRAGVCASASQLQSQIILRLQAGVLVMQGLRQVEKYRTAGW